MTNPLPAEMLDLIINYLHNSKDTLRNCCLVSKSWVPRARQHLFAVVHSYTPKALRSWKETFPDPSTSPARYTKTLFINGAEVVTAADAEIGGWIRGFSRVVRLEVESHAPYPGVGTLSCPIPWNLARDQIPPRGYFRPSVLAHFRPYPFIPSARGLGRNGLPDAIREWR